MKAIKYTISIACTAALLCAGCASSPELERQREAKEADIAIILNAKLDPAEYGETTRCLSDSQYRSFRPLDDKRILFTGRGDKLWINTLRSRCMDLRHGDVLIVQSFSAMRMCDGDHFEATDWFAWPWYRRTPWHWRSHWGTGPSCTLGSFQPVTKAQVAEIESIIEAKYE